MNKKVYKYCWNSLNRKKFESILHPFHRFTLQWDEPIWSDFGIPSEVVHADASSASMASGSFKGLGFFWKPIHWKRLEISNEKKNPIFRNGWSSSIPGKHTICMNRVESQKPPSKNPFAQCEVGRVISSHHESLAPKLPTKWRCWNRNPTQGLRKEKTDRKEVAQL